MLVGNTIIIISIATITSCQSEEYIPIYEVRNLGQCFYPLFLFIYVSLVLESIIMLLNLKFMLVLVWY